MEKMNKKFIIFIGIFFVASLFITVGLKNNFASGKDVKAQHKSEHTPVRLLMETISNHTVNILDAILIGDYDAVVKESDTVVNKCESLVDTFFPKSGEVGEWFEETGKDPTNPKDVKAVKEEFSEYANSVIDAANDITATAKKSNIAETYNSFDSMLRNACFKCHTAFRIEWTDWPKLQIGGG